jgi:hypothetical protein
MGATSLRAIEKEVVIDKDGNGREVLIVHGELYKSSMIL